MVDEMDKAMDLGRLVCAANETDSALERFRDAVADISARRADKDCETRMSAFLPLIQPERPKHDPFFAKAMWAKPRRSKRPFRYGRHNLVPSRERSKRHRNNSNAQKFRR